MGRIRENEVEKDDREIGTRTFPNGSETDHNSSSVFHRSVLCKQITIVLPKYCPIQNKSNFNPRTKR